MAVAIPTICNGPVRRASPPREGTPAWITRPPEATAQYPRPAGAAEIPTTGDLSAGGLTAGPAFPKAVTLPLESVSQ